jgi:hypothetical protein
MHTKKLKTKSLIGASLLTAVLAAGCSKEPEKIEHSTNPKIAIETLFSHDGCKVYRFEDGGRDHYFARCANSVDTSNTYTTSCGKGCVSTQEENIRTEGR